jgi:NitT/TauT family transport system substrate-binding protein
MKTRHLICIVLSTLLCTVAAITGCSRGTPDTKAIRLGYLQSDLHHLPAFVAIENGFFEDEGLKVAVGGIFRAGPEEMSAFAAEELDVGYVGLAPAATAALNGVADISILSQVNIEGSAVVCRPNDCSTLAQLRGKTVAIPGHATMQDCLIQKGLLSAGLTPRDLRLMVLKPPEMLQAMTADNIDCYIAWEPYPAQAVSTGAGEILARSSELWKEHPCCVLIASGNFARTRPEDTAKLIRAHRRACRFIAEHPIDALAIAVRYTGMSHDTITEAMAHMRYAPDIDKEKAGEFAGFLSELNYLSPDRGQHRQLVFFQ